MNRARDIIYSPLEKKGYVSAAESHIVEVPLVLVGLIAAAYILIFMKSILIPFVFAMLLVYVIRPVADFFYTPFEDCCRRNSDNMDRYPVYKYIFIGHLSHFNRMIRLIIVLELNTNHVVLDLLLYF